MAHKWVISPFTLGLLKIVANFRFGGHCRPIWNFIMKIEYWFNPPIYFALYIFCHWSISISPIAYKITFTVWGKLPPTPVTGERGKNTVAGLRVKTLRRTTSQQTAYNDIDSSICTKTVMIAVGYERQYPLDLSHAFPCRFRDGSWNGHWSNTDVCFTFSTLTKIFRHV